MESHYLSFHLMVGDLPELRGSEVWQTGPWRRPPSGKVTGVCVCRHSSLDEAVASRWPCRAAALGNLLPSEPLVLTVGRGQPRAIG